MYIKIFPGYKDTIKALQTKGLVHATLYEFENGGLTLKTYQMFSVHTSPEEFKNATIHPSFFTWFEDKSVIVLDEIHFQITSFPLHENEKSAFSNSFDLKGVLGKLRFRDGLV